MAKLEIALAAADGVVNAGGIAERCESAGPVLGLGAQDADEVLKSILAPSRSSDEPVALCRSPAWFHREDSPSEPMNSGGV